MACLQINSQIGGNQMKILTIMALLATSAAALVSQAQNAPFYPSFHNVPYETLAKNFSYYPNKGLTLQTLSLYQVGSQTMAAGSFDQFAPKPMAHVINQPVEMFANNVNRYFLQVTARMKYHCVSLQAKFTSVRS